MAQFTKKAIIEAFVELLNEESFDKITVIDIAERCGVNRNTFYYYYQDVYALVDEMFRTETDKIISAHRDFDTWQEGFLEATTFARANKEAIYHIYNSINREKLETYIYDVTEANMATFIRKQAEGLRVSEEDIGDLAVFYTVALEGLVFKWLHGGMKQDPESYIANMGRLLDGNIRDSLMKVEQADNPVVEPAGEKDTAAAED